MEIERKWLIKCLPKGWRPDRGRRIRQGYFRLRTREVQIRVRQIGAKFFLTVKSGDGEARFEEEIEISKRQFAHLWPLVRDVSIQKTRYTAPFAGRAIELDVYQGRHRGLMTADIEFSSRRQAHSFRPPNWFSREITGNRRYGNESLARRGRL